MLLKIMYISLKNFIRSPWVLFFNSRCSASVIFAVESAFDSIRIESVMDPSNGALLEIEMVVRKRAPVNFIVLLLQS